ncbi:hypothetical protein [Roseibium salinum]|uniref:Dehydrogenase n=1 Tax=Roseibium salinum TaxID=1604349 RepID=A0ABT3R4Q5_9HYPH|nr:hypothetical protein [Roseibium sp. DSM 29163]MCX2724251.1 hypothetical protein [Roseibium sp. DSM 29163]
MTRDTGNSEALWYTGVEECAIESVGCSAPQAGEVLVRTLFSGISRGTERLVFRGEVPESEWQRMRAPFQAGNFPHPVKYGYANVGRVIDGDPDLTGRIVFSLFPHQSVFTLPSASCVPVPDGVPAQRAVLAANMETAISAIWDGKPSPGDHICVVGGGVVGLLTAYLGSRIPGTRVTLVDLNERRAALAGALGLAFALPPDAPGGRISSSTLVQRRTASQPPLPPLATALRSSK